MKLSGLFACAMLCLMTLSACTSIGNNSLATGNNSLAASDVTKVTCVYNFGSMDGAEMDVYTPDGTLTMYVIQPYSGSSVDLFAGEVPSEDECEIKELTFTNDDWNSIVDAINKNNFMNLPEELPKVEADDGSSYYITVETTSGTHKSGGYCAGNGIGNKHERFGEVKMLLYRLKSNKTK